VVGFWWLKTEDKLREEGGGRREGEGGEGRRREKEGEGWKHGESHPPEGQGLWSKEDGA
jgi:hypothetical protein